MGRRWLQTIGQIANEIAERYSQLADRSWLFNITMDIIHARFVFIWLRNCLCAKCVQLEPGCRSDPRTHQVLRSTSDDVPYRT